MGKINDWIERLLSKSSKPTKPASSMFDGSDREAKEKAKDYDMKMAVERERSRRSSF